MAITNLMDWLIARQKALTSKDEITYTDIIVILREFELSAGFLPPPSCYAWYNGSEKVERPLALMSVRDMIATLHSANR